VVVNNRSVEEVCNRANKGNGSQCMVEEKERGTGAVIVYHYMRIVTARLTTLYYNLPEEDLTRSRVVETQGI